MPFWMTVPLIAGLVLATALTAVNGAAQVGTAFLSVGWGLALVILARLVQLTTAGLAWRVITPPVPPVSAATFAFLRLIRESINALLPMAQIGGDLIGARLLTFFGPSGVVAGASIIADIFVQVTTQFVFASLGFAVLVSTAQNSPLIAWIAYGLLTAGPILILFFFAQRIGGFRLIEKVLLRLAAQRQWFSLGQIADLDNELRVIYQNSHTLLLAFSIHFVTWLFGTCEIWIGLRFMGHPLPVLEALAIEALGQAVRGAAFVVPGAYGIQEGGFVALCAAFGVPADAALALSLMKRVPDIALGVPGLIAWQSLEGHRLWNLRGRKTG